MDNSNEETHIQFYDGSTYHDLRTFSHEYNRQGWVQVTVPVPSSYLSTNNYVRFKGYGGGGDHFAVDNVVVSDILHEYTQPTSPGSLTLDTSIDREITASWSRDAAFGEITDLNYRKVSSGSTNQDGWHTGTQHTVTTLDDGEDYEIEIRTVLEQYRNGTSDFWLKSPYTSSTAITKLPAPNNLSVSNIGNDSADLSWSNNQNYGYQRLYQHKTKNRAGMDFDRSTGDYINIPNDSAIQIESGKGITIGAWVYPETVTGNNEIISKDNEFLISIENGSVFIRTWGDNNSGSPSNVPTEEWTHIAVTWNNNDTAKVYFNGVLDEEVSVNDTNTGTTSDLEIGRRANNDEKYFNGYLANVEMHKTVLSDSQIDNIADGGLVVDGLVGYWPLNQNNSGTTPDVSEYANDGTVNGPSLIFNKSALTFETDSSYADTPDLGNSGAFSISAEFKKLGTDTRYISDGRAGSDNWWLLTHYKGSDINFNNGPQWNGLQTDSWTHVTGATDSNESELFVDGDSKDTAGGFTGVLDTVRFGLRYSNNRPLKGEIRNVQIHNRKLSASEAKQIAEGEVITDGLLAYYPMSEINNGETPDLHKGNNASVGSGVTEYGNGPKIKALNFSDITTTSLDSLLNDTTYKAYVHSETEHSTTRDT